LHGSSGTQGRGVRSDLTDRVLADGRSTLTPNAASM
jgi:hypothetical protein